MTDRFLQFLGRSNSWPRVWRFILAAAIVILATIARLALSPELGTRFVYPIFFPAVSVAAILGGVAGGGLATVLSVIVAWLIFDASHDVAGVLGAMSFTMGCAVVVIMAGLLQVGRVRIAKADDARRSAVLLGRFVAHAPAALAMFDLDMRYIATSQRWLSDYGLANRTLIGVSHYDIFPEISETRKSVHKRALGGENVRAEEDRFERADGTEQWLRWEVRPWRREDGVIGGIIIFSENISQRKEQEAQLARSEALFRAIFENANIGIASFSPNAKWLRVNARLCEITGYSAEELTSRSFLEISHPDDVAATLDHARRMFAGEIESYTMENRYLCKDGSNAWVNVYVRGVRDPDGQIRYGVTVVEDISERKAIEAKLTENQKCLSADLDAMTRLQDLGVRFIRGDDPQPVLNEVVATAQAIAEADSGAIRIIDEATGRLRIAACRGLPDWWVQHWNDLAFPADESEKVAAFRKRLIVEDIEASPILRGTVAADVHARAGIRAITSFPLTSRSGRLVGFFSTHFNFPHRPDERTLRLLDLLSRQAADIIDAMQARQKLRESESRYRAIFDTALAGIVTIDEHGVIASANPAAQTMFGYDSKDMVGCNVSILMPHRYAIHRDEYIEAYKRTGVSKIIGSRRQLVGRRQTGVEIDIELTVAEWRDYVGRIFFTGLMSDISERNQAVETLRKFSQVVDQTASTVVITDVNGVIEYVNPRFTAVSGYSADEAIGQKTSLLKSGYTSEEVYRQLWRTISGGGVWRGEFHNKRKDGSLYWEAATISAIRDRGGRITHYAAIKDDISEKKEMEGQLAASLRMEAIGRLAGSVAHDFNNLLAVVAGNLELIKQRTDDPGILMLVNPALEAVESGANFNRQLLSLAGKRRTDPSPFVFNDRLRAIRTLLERGAGSGIELTFELAGDLWPSVADPGEMDGALLNLVANSRDAMPEGGTIGIETCNVRLDVTEVGRLSANAKPGDYIRVNVVDSGHGMRKEVLERALEPFFTTKDVGKGTGLGLSGVHSFVKRALGFVTFESRDGDGTTVSLYLPRSNRALMSQEKAGGDDIPFGDGEIVLVVDDDDLVREVTLKRIEALGYVAEAASSGAEAIARLRSSIPIDVVLSDVVMPGGMSGIELARYAHNAFAGIKILLATGFNEELNAEASGILDAPILHKPYSREQLARSLAKALGK